MKETLQAYGPLIGPFLAFMLGVLALYLKHAIDERLARRVIDRQLELLKELVTSAELPVLKDHGTDKGAMLVSTIQVARFYFRLVPLGAAIEGIERDIYKSSSFLQVRRFALVKRWFHTLLREVEDAREQSQYDDEFIKRVSEAHQQLQAATADSL